MRQTTGLSDWCHIASRVAGKNTGSCGILTDWTGILFHLTSFDISGVGNTPQQFRELPLPVLKGASRLFHNTYTYIYIIIYLFIYLWGCP